MQTKSNNANMLRVGMMLRGIYRIDGYLSSGGFGNTYMATNVEFREQVAIKEFFMKGVTQRDDNTSVVSVSNRDNEQQFAEQREKFKKEARRLRQMQNEHIVRVHDLFEENGTAYYVMDYVDGESLQERLKRTGKPMQEGEVMQILRQTIDALDAVHQQGIWHLDLKPANIMVDKRGVVKIIDFGASKQLNANKGGATTSTAVSYTNGFAPREQMEQNLDKFGPWTDFYALGATLYNVLSGKRPPLPSDIDDDESEDKHLALPMPGTVSAEMRNLVLWLMQTNRIKRPQSVGEIRQRLSPTTAEEETVVAAPLQAKVIAQSAQQQQPKPKPTPPNNKMRIAILAATAVVAATIVVLSVGRGSCSGGQLAEAGDTLVLDSIDGDTVIAARSLTTPFGSCTYVGEVDAEGRPHGWGEAKFDDGSYYRGPFVHGAHSGTNAYYRSEDGDTFKGEFRDNEYYRGKYTIAADSSYFDGTYKNGEPAQGKWYDKHGNEI